VVADSDSFSSCLKEITRVTRGADQDPSSRRRRGSHVEPDSAGHWTADLSPVGDPILGPFATRSEALAAEIAWLRDHWFVPPEKR